MRAEKEKKLEIENGSGVSIVTPLVDLDVETSLQLRRQLTGLIKREKTNIIIDLSHLNKIETSGLATLVEFGLKMQESGRDYKICGLREGVTDSLSFSQVKDVLNYCENCDEAAGSIKTPHA